MMQVSKSVLSAALVLGVLSACLAQAQERRLQPGFMSHAVTLYQPDDDCEQVTVQFAIANGSVHVSFNDIRELKDTPFRMSGGDVGAKKLYVIGGPNCKIELTLSKPQG
jgi:hypothetical protein